MNQKSPKRWMFWNHFQAISSESWSHWVANETLVPERIEAENISIWFTSSKLRTKDPDSLWLLGSQPRSPGSKSSSRSGTGAPVGLRQPHVQPMAASKRMRRLVRKEVGVVACRDNSAVPFQERLTTIHSAGQAGGTLGQLRDPDRCRGQGGSARRQHFPDQRPDASCSRGGSRAQRQAHHHLPSCVTPPSHLARVRCSNCTTMPDNPRPLLRRGPSSSSRWCSARTLHNESSCAARAKGSWYATSPTPGASHPTAPPHFQRSSGS